MQLTQEKSELNYILSTYAILDELKTDLFDTEPSNSPIPL